MNTGINRTFSRGFDEIIYDAVSQWNGVLTYVRSVTICYNVFKESSGKTVDTCS